MNKVSCWGAVEIDGSEFLYNGKPVWSNKDNEWYLGDENDKYIQVPNGTIKRLTGICLTSNDEPIEIR